MSPAQPLASSLPEKIKPFDYRAEAQQAYADFPWIRGQVIFVDATNNKLVFPERPNKKILHKLAVDKVMQEKIKEMGDKGLSRNLWWDGEKETYILLSTVRKDFSLLPFAAPEAHEKALSFDHELAHALFSHEDDLRLHPNFKEAAADAFSVIRHFQRFGTESLYIGGLTGQRAASLVFKKEGITHFTSPVIEKLLTELSAHDWNGMDPQQTLVFATQFAIKNWPGPKKLKELNELFTPFRNTWKDIRAGDATAAFNFAQTLSKPQPAAYKKWGKQAVDYLSENYGKTGRWPSLQGAALKIPVPTS